MAQSITRPRQENRYEHSESHRSDNMQLQAGKPQYTPSAESLGFIVIPAAPLIWNDDMHAYYESVDLSNSVCLTTVFNDYWCSRVDESRGYIVMPGASGGWDDYAK